MCKRVEKCKQVSGPFCGGIKMPDSSFRSVVQGLKQLCIIARWQNPHSYATERERAVQGRLIAQPAVGRHTSQPEFMPFGKKLAHTCARLEEENPTVHISLKIAWPAHTFKNLSVIAPKLIGKGCPIMVGYRAKLRNQRRQIRQRFAHQCVRIQMKDIPTYISAKLRLDPPVSEGSFTIGRWDSNEVVTNLQQPMLCGLDGSG